MSTREAHVRATLENASYLAGLRQMADATRRFSSEAKAGLKSAFVDAGRAGVQSLSDMGAQLRSTLSLATSLGGTLTFGEAARRAVNLTSRYKDLAFAIETSTGRATSWEDVGRRVEVVGQRWKRSNEELTTAFAELIKTTGDEDFASAALNASARAANASGASIASLGSIAEQLHQKFGIGADAIDAAMAKAVGLAGSKEGIEELAGSFGVLAASARTAGLSGQAGLTKTLGMLKLAGASGGNFSKELMSVVGLMEQLGDYDKAKQIQKTLQVKILDKGQIRPDALERILAKTGGKHANLSKVFSGAVLRFVSELGKSYEGTFNATVGTKEEKTAAALGAFRTALAKASESTVTAAKLEEEAKKRLNEPSRNLDDAINKMVAAFSKPEVLKAMDQLAEKLPKLAEFTAKAVSYAVENPKKTAAAIVGGKVATDVLPGLGVGILGAVGKAGAKTIAGKAGEALEGKKGILGKVGSLLAKVGGKGAAAAAGGAAKAAGAAASAMPEWFVGNAAAAANVAAPAASAAAAAAPAAAKIGLLAKAAGAVTAGGGAAVAGVGVAGAAAWAAAVDQLIKLKKETKSDGGIFAALGEAMSGSAARAGATPRLPAAIKPSAPVQLQPTPVVEQATEGVKKHAKAVGDTASKIDRLGQSATRLADYFDRLGASTGGGGGASHGPISGLPAGSGPMPANR